MGRLKLVAGIVAIVFLGLVVSGFCADSSGGMELVKDPTLSDISKDPGFWRARPSEKLGKQVGIDRTGKGHCLMLEVLNKEDVSGVAWQYSTPYNSDFGAGELTISFWIKTEDVVSLKEDYMWARPFFSLIGHINTDKGNVYKSFPCSKIFELGTNDWTKYELKFSIPDNVTDIGAVFNLRDCTGKMWIDDFSMIFSSTKSRF